MQVIHPSYGVFNKMAAQLAIILLIMLVCGFILGMVGKFILGKRAVGFFAMVGVLAGLYLAVKIVFG